MKIKNKGKNTGIFSKVKVENNFLQTTATTEKY